MNELQALPGYPEARALADRFLDARYCRMDEDERFVDGTQYEGLAPWLTTDASISILNKAPCVVDRSVERAIGSYVSLLVGNERWPTITSKPEEDDQGFDAIVPLSDDESADLGRGVKVITDNARLQRAAGNAIRQGARCGTSVTIFGVRAGKLVCDETLAKWCTLTRDAEGEPEELEIFYPYLEKYYDEAGKERVRCMLYRRMVNRLVDETYAPMVAPKSGKKPTTGWVVSESNPHAYGFAPFNWWAFDKRATTVNVEDGRPLHEGLLEEIHAVNRTQSRHHGAALYSGDPQYWETGVEEDENPAPVPPGMGTMQTYDGDGGESPTARAANRRWLTGPVSVPGGARMKGAGCVWRYTSENAKVGVMELSGEALDSLAKDREDLRRIIADTMHWVRLDPANMRGNLTGAAFSNLSGEAIRRLMQTQLDRASELRDDFRDGWLLPALSILLRIVLVHASRGGLYLPGADRIAAVASKFWVPLTAPTNDNAAPADNEDDVEQAEPAARKVRWFPPVFTLKWPNYIPKTDDEWSKVAKQVREDLKAGLITKRTAVEKLSPYYGIEDIDAYLESLEEEAEEKREQAQEKFASENAAMHGLLNGKDDDGAENDKSAKKDKLPPPDEDTGDDAAQAA